MRMIDADDLKRELGDTRYGKPVFRHTEFIRMDVLEEAIDKAPTLPNPCGKPCAFERPYGELKYHKYDRDYECSACNTRYDAFDLPVKTWNYCPNCGADMRQRILDEADDGAGKDGNVKEGEANESCN